MTPSDKNTTQVMAILDKAITRETHKGSVNRVRYQTLADLQQLVDAALPKKVTKAYSGDDFSEINLEADKQAKFQLQGYNQAIEDIRNNLIKAGVLNG